MDSIYIKHMLEFCEEYYDILSNPNYMQIDFRTLFKHVLTQIEDDIKIDSKDLKKQFVKLL